MAKKTSTRALVGIGFIVGLVIGLALFFGLYFGLPANCDSEDAPEVTVPPNNAKFNKAAIAADAGPCSKIGKDMLEKGGHAVDAAIAGMLCSGLYNFHSAGIGGGFFMSVYDAKTNKIEFINSRETAPIASTQDMYKGNSTLSQTGTLAVAVPGEIAGYWEAHQKYGKLDWKDLFEPSIKLAAEGVPVSSALATAIQKEADYIKNEAFNLMPILGRPDGTLKVEGDVVVHPQLANTLRRIAENGKNIFYEGELAKMIVDDLRDGYGDSIITLQDLKDYKPEVREMLQVDLDDDFTVYSPPPTASGAVLCLILNILDGYDFTPQDLANDDVLTNHRIVEAFKFAYAKRSQLGDDRNNTEVQELVTNMTSEWYAAELLAKITDDRTHNVSYYGADFAEPPNDSGTSHVSVVSEDGSAVGLTSTINLRFGSKVRGYRTGILFNDEMDDFSSPNITNYFGVPPSPNNFIVPGHRPLSSMTPTIVMDKKQTDKSKVVRIVSGASGGTKITTGTALSIMNHLWFGDEMDESVARLRLHHQLAPNYIEYEKNFDKTVLDGLKAKNHEEQSFDPPGSVVQAIARLKTGELHAVSDKRKGGYPAGL